MLAIAEEIGVTPAQVAMAWLRERAARSATTLVPIIGPRNLAQLDDYLGALDVDTDRRAVRPPDRGQRGPARRAPRGDRRRPGRLQGGAADRVIAPVVPVA